MSNRLDFAHIAVRREAFAFLPAPAPVRSGLFGRVLAWLRGLADDAGMALTPHLRRDLGLPAVAGGFVLDAEASRLGF